MDVGRICIHLCLCFFVSLGFWFLVSFKVKVELMNSKLIFIFAKFLAITGIIYSPELAMNNFRSLIRLYINFFERKNKRKFLNSMLIANSAAVCSDSYSTVQHIRADRFAADGFRKLVPKKGF